MPNLKKTAVKRRRGRPKKYEQDGPELIKKAALKAFAIGGFNSTSIQQIADMAGVAKPLIHYHFVSKLDLWSQAVTSEFDTLSQTTAEFAEEAVSASLDDFVVRFATAMVNFAAEHQYLIRIAIDETSKNSERAKWLKENFLLPIHATTTLLVTQLSGNDDPKNNHELASHIVPTLFGAINFPYIDADVIAEAYGQDVFSNNYRSVQIQLVVNLIWACIEQSRN